ncbi:meiotic recombination protein DMC1 [Emericellopsis cladophorae]|uniref:Meiotic recombination protein DMC1 n=1 Tax=Emericellopsis cladophorae TaxID=2686198 RepID=A0A9P9Y3Z0_9HYPO|nr:meiotic recombination protein DMC1 [Emericellopsis cladophorae]KAI6782693.1 meiotic recombination protein DMC1 [Emericellopsis cladophorae]
MSNADGEQPGGFINPGPGLPSPAPSSASTGSSPNLPHPRSRSLQSGSRKEEMVRRYVEDRLLHISRRYVKKFGDPDVGSDVVGYKTFSEVARDLDTVINVLWLSATQVLSGVPEDEDAEDGVDDESDENNIDESDGPESSVRDASVAWDIDEDMMHLDAARIYENTIVQLGGRLGDPLGAVNMTED